MILTVEFDCDTDDEMTDLLPLLAVLGARNARIESGHSELVVSDRAHTNSCNVPNAGGCYTPWCRCWCHRERGWRT